MDLFWYYIAGFFIANSIPHLIPGILGQTHMTPFKRVSSPMLNVVWGLVNLFAGLYVLGIAAGTGGIILPWDAQLVGSNLWAFLAGIVSLAFVAAWLFGRKNARLPWQTD